MNIKNLLLPLGLALLSTWAIQYFIINRYFNPEGTSSGAVQSGQSFTAYSNALEAKPLNKEVDFLDAYQGRAETTTVETPGAIYEFSTAAASLQQLTFKRTLEGRPVTMNTVASAGEFEKETRCFLVALEQKTPFVYRLTDKRKSSEETTLVYTAQTDQAIIEKTFVVHHGKFQIDLLLAITPKATAVQPRILFSSPYVPEIAKDDTISAVYNTQKGALTKELREKLDMNKGWFAPTFFGSDDRYFVHAMIADPNSFARRAYYNVNGQHGLISILEGPEITKKTEWKLSFFFGPKEEEVMRLVDPRLEQTLDYSGVLSILAHWLLEALKYLYSYLGNYGWAIVMLTFLINLVLLPLNLRSNKSMKQYQEYEKKLAYIQKKYKDDPDTLTRERAELVSKQGMSSIGGCLPKLLQLPIFFALSRVLSSSIELYRAPFILWIKDLSVKDPYYILPAMIAGFMLFQAPTNDPRQRFTMIAVSLVFAFFAANFSAGLCLYILVGVMLTGLQNMLQKKFNWA